MTALLDTSTPPPYDGAVEPVRAGRRWLRGPEGDPVWARPALAGLLVLTGLLYLWDLGASGWANSFYASAVQAGTQSWKAMLFGSLDSGNAITVDKPALFLWPMEVAGRIFGVNAWSMLVPQALEGVAAVGLLAATVRRTSGHAAGLLAGAALALTPVAALMFRFNNPDAMLTLLLVAAGWALVRSLEAASTRWLALAGLFVGLGFLTKMGQALLVVPALGLTYLVAAPTSLPRRLRQLLVAGAAIVAGAGWWIALVDLWPAGSRPYVGGSTNNSMLELALGYNGLGRLFGATGNGGGMGDRGGAGMAGNGGFGGSTGLQRLFVSDMATEASWLLPTALLALAVGLWLTRRAPRTDLARAALVLFGSWLLVTGLVFSEMQGTIHPYYTVALAPAITAVVAVTARVLWLTRTELFSRCAAGVLLAVTAIWDAHLLGSFSTSLGILLVVASAAVTLLLAVRTTSRRLVAVGLVAAAVAGLGGSAAYAITTAQQPHSGSIPSVGPVATSLGAPGGGVAGGSGAPGARISGAGSPGAGDDQASTAVTGLLRATTGRWAAATIGTQSAAPLQLASGKAVMAIGGFNGGDAAPTLAQFQAWVAKGEIHYFLSGNSGFPSGNSGFLSGNSGFGGGGGPQSGGTGAQISSWVAAHYTATTVGGSTVYDLTAASS